MHFKPIPLEGLKRLKEELAFNNAQMADMFGLATGRQFHKYLTSEKGGREMGFHVTMYGMLGLAFHRHIRVANIDVLFDLAREYGAAIDPDSTGDGSQQD